VIILILTAVPAVAAASLLIIWAYVLVAVVDCFFVGRRITKKLSDKYGADNVERGLKWYAAMRSLQLKIMRLPKPQVKRGEFPA
jgi:hypothetical protein